jgi:MAF protein
MSESVQIVLASNSPRRKELLSITGWGYTSVSADIDETCLPEELPNAHVRRLAMQKAESGGNKTKSLVLGADTIVVDGGQILGKPANPKDAIRMLQQLRGRTHQVMTAITIFDPSNGKLVEDFCSSSVLMRGYTDIEMHAYVDSGDPLDKAGAYAIQHPEFHPVEQFQGCFASVMGLPLCHLQRLAKQVGLNSVEAVENKCQQYIKYECPIHHLIARGENVG